MTTSSTVFVSVVSAMATRIQNDEYDPMRATEWSGDLPALSPEEAFRFFNRVTESDSDRLEALGYRLPSMSVGDLLTIGTETWQCASVGFVKVDPPKPCGYCRRCAIHDDPGGCLEVAAWEREALDTLR
jgi:hypothetical protein